MVKAIQKKGGRVKYILFEGEGHGWRKAEHIKKGLEAELAWYQDVFGLKEVSSAML
jgi:dipeptidyl aminopeptidase/acylaminoacyl peptidase